MKFVLSLIASATVASLSLAALPAAAQGLEKTVAAVRAGKSAYEPGELLVQLRRGAATAELRQTLSALNGRVASTVRAEARRSDAKGDLLLARLPRNADLAAVIERLSALPSVEFAEPNWIAKLHARTPDPLYADGSMWGLYGDASPLRQNPFGSQAAEAAAAGSRCDPNLVVGMVDAGVMTMHEDLAANVWQNPAELANGLDDDGNGLIDDLNGYDFRNKKGAVFSGSEDNHGTHTSGTIGAVRLNGLGVAGVCDRVQIVAGKAFGGIFGSGRTNDIIRAVDYLTDLKVDQGVNIVVTNNSWGGSEFSQATFDAYVRQTNAGILVVASAGNNGSNADSFPSYPAAFNLPNIISVAAITSTGALASYSNFGATSVDIGAPGSSVFSTTVGARSGSTYLSAYGSLDGTSMAAPHVTGAALLYKSQNPGATAADIKAAILAAAVPTPSLAGRTVTGGRLDVSGF